LNSVIEYFCDNSLHFFSGLDKQQRYTEEIFEEEWSFVVKRVVTQRKRSLLMSQGAVMRHHTHRPAAGKPPKPEPPSVDSEWSKYGWWLLSDDNVSNPDLWGWNHVLVPYCSQDLHSGQVKSVPVSSTLIVNQHSEIPLPSGRNTHARGGLGGHLFRRAPYLRVHPRRARCAGAHPR
jgi:hypothetical protein